MPTSPSATGTPNAQELHGSQCKTTVPTRSGVDVCKKAGDLCFPQQRLPAFWKLHCDEFPRAQQRSQLNGSPCYLSELSSWLPPFGIDVFRLAALMKHMWYAGDRLGGTVADVATPVARAKILGTSGSWGGAAINVATCDAWVVTDTAVCVA